MFNCYYWGEFRGRGHRYSNDVSPSPPPELPPLLFLACHGARICLETSRCLSRCRSPSQGGSSRIQLDPRQRVSRACRLCTTMGTCKKGGRGSS